MNATTVAVDLAKNVFELAAADEHWKVLERARLTRAQFERWFQNRSIQLVVMEACATAHYWARTLRARGIEVRLLPAYRGNGLSRKLGELDGIGALTATAFTATVAHAVQFKNGRQCAAWLGLTPRQDSSGGKNRLLGITKRGDVYLRTLLVHGARSIMRHTAKRNDPKSHWVEQLRRRRGDNVAACALAAKHARILWALMAREQALQAPRQTA